MPAGEGISALDDALERGLGLLDSLCEVFGGSDDGRLHLVFDGSRTMPAKDATNARRRRYGRLLLKCNKCRDQIVYRHLFLHRTRRPALVKLKGLKNFVGEKKKIKRKFQGAAKAAWSFSPEINWYLTQRIDKMWSGGILPKRDHCCLAKITSMIVAPFEADQQLAFQSKVLRGLDRRVAVVSQDSDLLVYSTVDWVYQHFIV